MKRVLFISSRADLGGGPKHLLLLCEKLKNSHFIAIAAPAGERFSKELRSNCNHYIPIPSRAFSLVTLLRIFFLCLKFDIRNIHSHGRGAGYYSRLLGIVGFNIIHTFHGVHRPSGLKGFTKYFSERPLKVFTNKFICVSLSEREIAIKYKLANPQKIIVIPNSVKPLLKDNKNDSMFFTFGCLCRLEPIKGLETLIEFFKIFNEKHDIKFKVLIAGVGELSTKLKDLIDQNKLKNKLELIGMVEAPEYFFNKIDAYLSFSHREGMPLSVLEAMSCGIPCLLSNVPGHSDIINHKLDGLLFNLQSYSDFETHSLELIKSKDLRNFLGKNAELKIKTQFSLDSMVESTKSLYL